MAAARARALALAMLALATFALAESSGEAAEAWSVQTVAVRDLRTADAIAAELTSLGFGAYTEFAMRDGVQWVRVRVGCFLDRADADRLAELLRGRFTRDAVVVPWSGAAASPCLERQIGFVVPERWRQDAAGAPAFEVEVGGVLGFIRFLEDRWQLLQAPATEALDPLPDDVGRFAQSTGLPSAFVHERTADGRVVVVCAGTLLAQTTRAAIVELDGIVSACLPGRHAPRGAP